MLLRLHRLQPIQVELTTGRLAAEVEVLLRLAVLRMFGRNRSMLGEPWTEQTAEPGPRRFPHTICCRLREPSISATPGS